MHACRATLRPTVSGPQSAAQLTLLASLRSEQEEWHTGWFRCGEGGVQLTHVARWSRDHIQRLTTLRTTWDAGLSRKSTLHEEASGHH
jgi:hypothetical protein